MALKIEKFQSPGKGNGLRATALLSPGDLLYIAEPFSYTVNQSSWGKVCEFCLRNSPNLLQCSRCKFAKYCNKRCQTKAWLDHKRECKCLKSMESKEETYLVRFAVKTILKLLQKKPCPSEDLYSVSELVSNFNSEEMKIQCVCLTYMLRLYLKEEIPYLSQWPADLNLPEHFAKLFWNQIMIMNEELEPIAHGLYPSMSLLNHSCDPNCEAVFKGKHFHLRAIKEIQAGEELTISYILRLLPTSERQSRLRYSHCFECDCHRCRARDKDEYMLAGDKQASDETEDLLPRVNVMQDMEMWAESLALCEAQLKKNSGRLPDENIFQHKLLSAAMDACMTLNMFRESLEYSLRTLGPLRLIFPGYSSHLGLRMRVVGIAQVMSGNRMEGLDNLREALSILKVVYGEDHTQTQFLVRMLEMFQLLPPRAESETNPHRAQHF